MSVHFECGDNVALVTYLYDESDPDARSAIEAHLRLCPACAAELAALTSTSRVLSSWRPPDLDVDFRIVAEPRAETVLRPASWWQRPLPGWAQAAAAVVVFGVGMTLGIARGGSEPEPGATASSPLGSASAVAPAAAGVGEGGAAASRAELAALEQRLRAELQQAQTRPATVAPVTASAAPTEARLLARVRTLIEESEQRQRRELALRTAAVVRDIDAQRQFDMTRIQRAFGQFEGSAGAEIQRQRQDLNNLIRVSQSPR